MIARSPVMAMLWENWRLTRSESAQRLAQGILISAAVLAGVAAFGRVGNERARLALGLLVMTYLPLWLSVARLNGGRFMDGFRPGYPFYVLYTRPVRTLVLVAAPMAYNVATAVALYLASALVLRAIFGVPIPLLPLAVWIAATHIVQWAAQWGTSSKVVQWCGSIGGVVVLTALAVWRGKDWPAQFDFSPWDYALMTAISLAAFGLTVAGVARQRRGDAKVAPPHTETRGRLSDWLAARFRFSCPITSATRAQVWFDLKSSGLTVLAIGGALALAIPLLFVVTAQVDIQFSGVFDQPATRAIAVIAAFLSVPALLTLGGNAFGIRTRQGRRFASVFEATQGYGTARIAGLKVLVHSVCLLAALVAVGASAWTSGSLIPFDVLDDGDPLLRKARLGGLVGAIEGPIGAMNVYQLLALAFVLCTGVAILVALRASLAALRARYPRHVSVAGWALLLYGLAQVALALAGRGELGVEPLWATYGVVRWVLTALTIYVAWRVVAERLLSARSAGGVLLISAAFATAWVTLLRATGVQLDALAPSDALGMLWPAVLPLTASVLAPWSLSRVRHL